MQKSLVVAALALNCLAMAQNGFRGNPADLKEIQSYPLTMEKIRQWSVAAAGLQQLQQKDPVGMKKSMEGVSVKSIADCETAFTTKMQAAGAVVKRSGLTAREFCVLPQALMPIVMGLSVQRRTGQDAAQIYAGQSPGNVDFVKKNFGQIEPLMRMRK